MKIQAARSTLNGRPRAPLPPPVALVGAEPLAGPEAVEPPPSSFLQGPVGARSFFDRPVPADYAREWAERLARPEPEAPADPLSVMIFRIGAEWLALPTTVLVEVADAPPVHTVPHRTNDVFCGVVNVRGQLRLCVSLQGLLGVEPALNGEGGRARPRMVIIQERGANTAPWVFPAEDVVGVHRVTESELRRAPAAVGRAHACGRAVFTFEGHSVGLLDESRLFSNLRDLGQ